MTARLQGVEMRKDEWAGRMWNRAGRGGVEADFSAQSIEQGIRIVKHPKKKKRERGEMPEYHVSLVSRRGLRASVLRACQ